MSAAQAGNPLTPDAAIKRVNAALACFRGMNSLDAGIALGLLIINVASAYSDSRRFIADIGMDALISCLDLHGDLVAEQWPDGQLPVETR